MEMEIEEETKEVLFDHKGNSFIYFIGTTRNQEKEIASSIPRLRVKSTDPPNVKVNGIVPWNPSGISYSVSVPFVLYLTSWSDTPEVAMNTSVKTTISQTITFSN